MLTSVTIPVDRLFSLGLRRVADFVRGCMGGVLDSSLMEDAAGMDFVRAWNFTDLSMEEVGVA